MHDRFAPSPTGLLHLGHAYSAILGHDAARAAGGRWAVRLEDLDRDRCRPAYAARILDDIAWLGLRIDGPVVLQSAHRDRHIAAAERLAAAGLAYPCGCSRSEIAAAAAPQEGVAPPPVYPGTCRGRPPAPGRALAWRLDLAAALARIDPGGLDHLETGPGDDAVPSPTPRRVAGDPAALATRIGDAVLVRRDGVAAYHLAVVVDDAAMGITRVTRGADLAEATPLHRLLQGLLGLPAPAYHHHRLIRDAAGRRLAKRDDALSLATLRAAGWTPGRVRRHLGL